MKIDINFEDNILDLVAYYTPPPSPEVISVNKWPVPPLNNHRDCPAQARKYDTWVSYRESAGP